MSLPAPGPDRTCLITGASSGIGVDLARELAKRGHGVTLVARREAPLRELADELATANAIRAEVAIADLSDMAERDHLVAEVQKRGLTVEVLVNNAGFATMGPVHKSDPAKEVSMIRTDVEAVAHLCSAFLPGMVQRRRGAVLNVASTAAFQPLPGQSRLRRVQGVRARVLPGDRRGGALARRHGHRALPRSGGDRVRGGDGPFGRGGRRVAAEVHVAVRGGGRGASHRRAREGSGRRDPRCPEPRRRPVRVARPAAGAAPDHGEAAPGAEGLTEPLTRGTELEPHDERLEALSQLVERRLVAEEDRTAERGHGRAERAGDALPEGDEGALAGALELELDDALDRTGVPLELQAVRWDPRRGRWCCRRCAARPIATPGRSRDRSSTANTASGGAGIVARTSTGDRSRSSTLLAVMLLLFPPAVRVTQAPSARRRSQSTVPDDVVGADVIPAPRAS